MLLSSLAFRILAVCAAGALAQGALAQAPPVGGSPPEVRITEVLYDRNPLPYDSAAAPPLGRRNLEVRYRLEGAASLDSVRYQFRMEPFEDSWAEVGERTIAYYRNLPPGRHTFHVRAYDPAGAWASEAALPVVIDRYVYETRWFMALGAALLLALVGGAVWWDSRLVRRRARRLDGLVAERTREIEEARRATEAALARAERERATAEGALATVEEQAIQLLRLDHMKSRLFANLSHEFRTPLTLILDPLDRAVRDDGLDADARASLEQARLNAQRILRLINQVLDLAKVEAGSMELRAQAGDLIPFLRRTTELFESEAGRLGLALHFHAAAPELPAYFDRDKLERVVFNLMSNALKSTPRGGKVHVTVREVPDAEGGPGHAEITMRDTGVGIAADEVPFVFDRFFQGNAGRTSGGTGIGLALVKEFVEMHRGEVRVESTVGFGSTFTVCLPLGRAHLGEHEVVEGGGEEAEGVGGQPPVEVQAELPPTEDPTPPPSSPSPEALPDPPSDADGRPLVLVVEDHADIRRMIAVLLRPHYAVAEAADGEEGMRLARERRPALVITDLFMPHVNGLELCRRLKRDERLAGTPVILLTAHASDESRLEGLQTGADDFLTKPFSSEELLARVENLIRAREAMRGQFSQEVRVGPLGAAVPSADGAFMERVYDVLAEHLSDEAFSVPALAAAVGVSESQLKRKLKGIAGESPVEFIRNRRLDRAAELLRARVGTVGEVCAAVGFGSASYFAKCFRERFRFAPSDYADREAEASPAP